MIEPIKIGRINYYLAEDLKLLDSGYFKGCSNIRRIIDKKGIKDDSYIYAYVKDDVWIITTSKYTQASLLIKRVWCNKHVPKLKTKKLKASIKDKSKKEKKNIKIKSKKSNKEITDKSKKDIKDKSKKDIKDKSKKDIKDKSKKDIKDKSKKDIKDKSKKSKEDIKDKSKKDIKDKSKKDIKDKSKKSKKDIKDKSKKDIKDKSKKDIKEINNKSKKEIKSKKKKTIKPKKAKRTKKPKNLNKVEFEKAKNLNAKNLNAKNLNRKNKKAIPKTMKRLVWNEYIGEAMGESLCLCCHNKKITQMDFHCGHVISEKNGGDIVLTNLKPICALCNLSMGSTNMDEFMSKLGFCDI